MYPFLGNSETYHKLLIRVSLSPSDLNWPQCYILPVQKLENSTRRETGIFITVICCVWDPLLSISVLYSYYYPLHLHRKVLQVFYNQVFLYLFLILHFLLVLLHNKAKSNILNLLSFPESWSIGNILLFVFLIWKGIINKQNGPFSKVSKDKTFKIIPTVKNKCWYLWSNIENLLF